MYNTYFEEFRYLGELLAAALLLTLPSMERRPHFWPKCIGGFVALMLFTLVKQSFQNVTDHVLIQVIMVAWYCLLVALSAGYVAFCFKLNPTEILWITIFAFSIQHLEYVLINELLIMGLNNRYFFIKSFFPYAAVCVVSCVLLYFAVYKIFARYIRRRDHLYKMDTGKTRVLFLMLLVLLLAASFINQSNAMANSVKLNVLSALSDLFCCVLVLVVQYVNLRTNSLNLEKTTVTQLYEHTRKQYDAFKDSVDYVNIKCHDIKYQIRGLEREGRLNAENGRTRKGFVHLRIVRQQRKRNARYCADR